MKIDFSLPILDYEGQKIPETKVDTDGKTVIVIPDRFITMSSICVNAVNSAPSTEANGAKGSEAKEKVERFILCTKIIGRSNGEGAGEVELELEDVVMIKDLVGKAPFSPLIVGRVFEIIAEASASAKVGKLASVKTES